MSISRLTLTMATLVATTLAIAILLYTPAVVAAENPRYKPSSRSPVALDILDNQYGVSRSAPDALKIDEQAPDFSLAKAGGGLISLRELRKNGEVVIIFYRGHW